MQRAVNLLLPHLVSILPLCAVTQPSTPTPFPDFLFRTTAVSIRVQPLENVKHSVIRWPNNSNSSSGLKRTGNINPYKTSTWMFIVALFIIAKECEIPKCLSVDVVYIYFEILSHHKKK